MFLLKLCTLMENDSKLILAFQYKKKKLLFLNKNESNGKRLVTQLAVIVSLSVTNRTLINHNSRGLSS